MELKDYFGHVLALASMLSGGAVAVIRWLLASRDQQIKESNQRVVDLKKEFDDFKKAHDAAVAKAASDASAAVVKAAADAKADYLERMAVLAASCGKDLGAALQRLETLHAAHNDKWAVDVGNLQRQLNEMRNDLRGAERILGRYEVFKHGRTDEG